MVILIRLGYNSPPTPQGTLPGVVKICVERYLLFCYLIVEIDDSVGVTEKEARLFFCFPNFLVLSRIFEPVSTLSHCGGKIIDARRSD